MVKCVLGKLSFQAYSDGTEVQCCIMVKVTQTYSFVYTCKHNLYNSNKHCPSRDVLHFVFCDSDHYLVVAKLRERLAVNKKAAQKFEGERFNLRKLNELEVKEKCHIEITNRFAAWRTWMLTRT